MNSYAKNKTTLRQKKEKIRKIILSTSFRVGLMVCIFAFGFMYVWQTNTVSTKGYEFSDLEKQITVLERETQKLDVDIAKHTSMQSIQDRLKDTNLVSITYVDYLTPVDTMVARN